MKNAVAETAGAYIQYLDVVDTIVIGIDSCREVSDFCILIPCRLLIITVASVIVNVSELSPKTLLKNTSCFGLKIFLKKGCFMREQRIKLIYTN